MDTCSRQIHCRCSQQWMTTPTLHVLGRSGMVHQSMYLPHSTRLRVESDTRDRYHRWMVEPSTPGYRLGVCLPVSISVYHHCHQSTTPSVHHAYGSGCYHNPYLRMTHREWYDLMVVVVRGVVMHHRDRATEGCSYHRWHHHHG